MTACRQIAALPKQTTDAALCRGAATQVLRNFPSGARLRATCQPQHILNQSLKEVCVYVLPHPCPLPKGGGTALSASGLLKSPSTNPVAGFRSRRRTILLLPGGEGRDEGEPQNHSPALVATRDVIRPSRAPRSARCASQSATTFCFFEITTLPPRR